MKKTFASFTDQPSPLQEEVVRYVHQVLKATGAPPSLRKISNHLGWTEPHRSKNLRYHLRKMVRLGYLSQDLELGIYAAGRREPEAIRAGATHGVATGKRQGCCPERARSITRLLISDSHAVDRFARLFSGEWQKGVAL